MGRAGREALGETHASGDRYGQGLRAMRQGSKNLLHPEVTGQESITQFASRLIESGHALRLAGPLRASYADDGEQQGVTRATVAKPQSPACIVASLTADLRQ